MSKNQELINDILSGDMLKATKLFESEINTRVEALKEDLKVEVGKSVVIEDIEETIEIEQTEE